MEQRSSALAAGGVLAIAAGTLVGRLLAGEMWSAGSIGYPLLLSVPGVWLVSRAAGAAAGLISLAAFALATALIGLDVVDSARREVVVTGWCVALVGVIGLQSLVAVATRIPNSEEAGQR